MCEFKVTALILAERSLMKLHEERHPTIAERNNQQVQLGDVEFLFMIVSK